MMAGSGFGQKCRRDAGFRILVTPPPPPPAIYSWPDQMPLYRNESSEQATLNFKGQSQNTYVKENHMLPRERATVMTRASSQAASPPPSLEFIFKGKGIRVKINPPQGVNVQWAEKGSYRLEHLLKFVSTLKSQPVLFSQAQYKILYTGLTTQFTCVQK